MRRQGGMGEHGVFQGTSLVWNKCLDCGCFEGRQPGYGYRGEWTDHKRAHLHKKEGEFYLAGVVNQKGFFFFFFFFVFSGLHLQHMEVPRLGVELELQLPAYATAIATPDPSCVCDLLHSSRQCWILNTLSKARD